MNYVEQKSAGGLNHISLNNKTEEIWSLANNNIWGAAFIDKKDQIALGTPPNMHYTNDTTSFCRL